MKILKNLALAASLAVMGTQAHAASGQTSVSFNFPDIVILHYVEDVTFNIPAGALGSDSISEGSGGTLSGFVSPTLSGNANVGITIAQALNGYKGTINNAWAVRGITSSGNIQVKITLDSQDATNGTSKVVLSNPMVESSGVAAAQQITINAPGFAASNAVYGDVHFDLDFSNVTASGTHSGALYTVEATAI